MHRLIALIALLLTVSTAAVAQIPEMDSRRSHKQILALGLYPPDIIMRHQQALGITDDQRKRMLGLVRNFQNEVAELQWNLQNEQQHMLKTLAQDKVDKSKAIPQVERVLALENQFKFAHFKLLIAIKNELTEKQIGQIKDRIKQRRR